MQNRYYDTLGLILAVSTALLAGCTHLLFFPMEKHVLTPEQTGTQYEDIVIKANDGTRLHGWRLRANTKAVGTLLYFHGNAENISTHFLNVNWLTKKGYNVYLFDYRGYGKSEGNADLDLTIQDAELMIRHVVEHSANKKIAVIGQSLGASISIYAVAHSPYKQNIAALISVSGFSDYHDVAQDFLSKSWLLWLFQWPLSFTINNRYSPVESIGLVSPTKMIIMQSTDDEMIEMYHAERLMDAAQEPKKLILLRGGHNEIFNDKNNKKSLLDALNKINFNQH